MKPQKIGNYEVLEKLRHKGVGVVYKGRMGDTYVTLKIISPQIAKDEEFKERFLREMNVISVLDHPNIVRAINYGHDSEINTYYLALEYIEGETLVEGLNRLEKFPISMALNIAKNVAKGLSHAAQRDIVHRDINPENILLGDDGTIKIINFGLAKFTQKSSITQAGTVLGSPYYLAPEQALTGQVDIRADIYSLGITLYHLIAGRPPFFDKIPIRVIQAHCEEPLPDIEQYTPEVTPRIKELLKKMTEKSPEDRYSSPQDIVHIIRNIEG